MKLIIAGSRHMDSLSFVSDVLRSFCIKKLQKHEEVTEVISGGATGIDSCGELWAKGYDIKVTKFPAQWKIYGPSAGPRRNREMASYADAAVVIWDGESRGSANMIEEMKKAGKPAYSAIFSWKWEE